jgi:glycosyltransferase involved in cell wall biosynthesis
MRIGVDATCWGNGRGYGRYTRELLRAMVSEGTDNEFVCFVDERAAARFDLVAPNVRTVLVQQSTAPTSAASAEGHRSVADMLRMTRAVGRAGLDVFFQPSVYTFFPLPPTLAAVVTFHDAIAERFPHLTLPTPRARLFWRAKVAIALLQSRLVLTVSDHSARDLTKTLRVPPKRMRVALEAASPIYRPSESVEDIAEAALAAGVPPGRRWFVYLGGFSPHKNVDVLIRAHSRLAASLSQPPVLLLVGDLAGDPFLSASDRIRKAIRESGAESIVRWTGFLSDETVRQLLSGAVALVLPSECEGFGLPAVEAAACGTPAIATTDSPLPELLEGGGIFVTPGDENALYEAMKHLYDDEAARHALGVTARERSQQLSWQRSARAALSALAEAAA